MNGERDTMNAKSIVGIATIVVMVVLLCGFGGEQAAGFLFSTGAPHQMAGPRAAEAAESDEASLYQMDVKPLTAVECARCHYSVFETIKNRGGKHQIECVRCHREYHVYNPRKHNFDEIMPKCGWCHSGADGGPFHGSDPSVTACLHCHGDPHKPRSISVAMPEIATVCARCHEKEGGEIAEHLSKHTTEVTCADCHADKHGYIPVCSECHESHSPDVELATEDCMACHPVHHPLQITYGETTESTICAGCHKEVDHLLQKKVTKHTAVPCVDCHPAHKEIPPCSRCHGEPHPKGMKATECGQCHGIAHDLLM